MTPIDNKFELAMPIRDRADVLGLNDEEHRLLARWLTEAGAPTAIPAAARRRRRRRVLLSATAAAVALALWLIYIAATLPDRQRAHDWRLAWVGFDGALMLAFAAIAWFGRRSRQIVITAFLVTATLLLCDAWFDVVLSWGSAEQTTAIVTAIGGELPFAVFLLTVYHRLVRALTAQIWRDRGRAGDPPPLRQLPLLLLPAPVDPPATGPEVSGNSRRDVKWRRLASRSSRLGRVFAVGRGTAGCRPPGHQRGRKPLRTSAGTTREIGSSPARLPVSAASVAECGVQGGTANGAGTRNSESNTNPGV